MRSFGSFALTCAVYLGANCAFAQAIDDPPLQFDPYNKHHDRHLGHNHVYPDRGAVFRDAPKGSTIVNYAGLAYRFYNGVWFEPRGPAFIVVMPPIGVVVPSLPPFATTLKSGAETYLYANEVYYLARPDLGGYEVVNEPEGSTPLVKSAAPAAGTATAVASSALPVGTTAVATQVAPIPKTHLASLGTTGQPAAPTGVASAQVTSRVPGAPQTLTIPSEPEDNADAEIKAYSYAPDTAKPASKVTTASGSTSQSTGAGVASALIVPAVAGASLAVTQAGGGAPTASTGPGASNWTVTEIRGTKTVPLTSASTSTTVPAPSGSAAVGPEPSVASNSTVAIAPTTSGAGVIPASAVQGSAAFATGRSVASHSTDGPPPVSGAENPPATAGAPAADHPTSAANNPTVAASSPTGGPSAGPVPAAAGAAAVGVAPALASNSTPPATPTVAGAAPATAAPPAATGSEGPVRLATSTPSVATPPAPEVTATNAAMPRSPATYTYTSPPSTSDYPTNGTIHTTAEAPNAATAPALASATTISSPSGASSSPGSVRFTAYPRSGQSADQQARDAYDCYRFGVAETGFDPMSGTVPAAGKPGQAEFDRARAACFEGRGYSLK